MGEEGILLVKRVLGQWDGRSLDGPMRGLDFGRSGVCVRVGDVNVP